MASVAKREWTHDGQTKTAWVVRYTDQNGKRRMKTFEKKKDADHFRSRIQIEVDRGLHIPDRDTVTVAEASALFLRHSEQMAAQKVTGESCLRTHRSGINLYIVPRLGARKFNSLHVSDVEGLYNSVIDSGLTARTAKRHVITLRLIEKFAMKRGFVAKPVVADVLSELRPTPAPRIRVFKVNEARMLLSTVDVRSPRRRRRADLLTRCFVHLAAFCGLRLGEIIGLTAEAIDLPARVIHVRHSLTHWDELKGPKTRAGLRDVPLPHHICELLSEWLRDHFVPNERRLVFRSVNGGHFSSSYFHRCCWRPLLKRSGLIEEDEESFRFHALRHFAASMMIEMNVPLPEVASLLGHSKFDTTLQTYAHSIAGGNRRHATVDVMSSRLLTRQGCNKDE